MDLMLSDDRELKVWFVGYLTCSKLYLFGGRGSEARVKGIPTCPTSNKPKNPEFQNTTNGTLDPSPPQKKTKFETLYIVTTSHPNI